MASANNHFSQTKFLSYLLQIFMLCCWSRHELCFILHDGVSPRHEIEKSCPEKRRTAISKWRKAQQCWASSAFRAKKENQQLYQSLVLYLVEMTRVELTPLIHNTVSFQLIFSKMVSPLKSKNLSKPGLFTGLPFLNDAGWQR